MRTKIKKLISVCLSVIMILSILTVAPISVSAMTNQQGADWALNRIGAWIDTDGYYGAQCKDFVNAFTSENFGVTIPGNANNLIYASLPTGWQRIKNTPDFLPQPGDIAVWDAWSGNPNGHTGIIVWADLNSFDSVDQNWVNSSSNGSAAARVKHSYTTLNFWGVVRPPYQNDVPAVANSWITVDKNTILSGDTVTFNLGADNANPTYTIGIDKDGSRIITESVGAFASYKLSDPGDYSAYMTAHDSKGRYVDSNRVYFRVLSPLNLGDTFYGVILNTNCWKPIGICNDNVELQTEIGVASQQWKFERQSDNSYKIMSCENGKCLDLLNFITENENNIQLCTDNNTNAQRWYICKKDNGYTIVSKCSLEAVMDLFGNNTDDGTNIQIFKYHGDSSQIFSIYCVENEVYLNPPELSITQYKNQNVVFNWSKVYGENGFKLNIRKKSVNEISHIFDIDANVTTTETYLPAGDYEAYIEAYNYFEKRTSNVVSFTVQSQDLLGDVDGDGKISIDDVTDIQKHLANMVDFTKEQVSLADVDKNGTVSIDDVTLIQKHLAGLAVIE